MARSSKALNARASGRYKDYNPIPVNPLVKQFEPTDANPIRQHAQMAGDPTGDSTPYKAAQVKKEVDDAQGTSKPAAPAPAATSSAPPASRGKYDMGGIAANSKIVRRGRGQYSDR